MFMLGGQVWERDVYRQTSTTQAYRQDANNTANNFITGVSSDYRTYDPSTSKFANVATTRSSVIDPQKSFANFYGTGRYSNRDHWYANSSQVASANANRISYLAPSASRPKNYFWGQAREYINPTKAAFSNQEIFGLNFYRISDGNNVVIDQFMNDNQHWIYYNSTFIDDNLLTLSSAGAISKIKSTTNYIDNATAPSTPLLFQTHGGIPADGSSTWQTDYPRDSAWNSGDRESYVIYRPNFGSNTSIPTDIELTGEWLSNYVGGRSGR